MHSRCFASGLPAPGPRPKPPLTLLLPPGLLEQTQLELRAASAGRREAIVLWAGRPTTDGKALISHLVMPRFVSDIDHLTLPPVVRHELAAWLRTERLLVFADLHDHPAHAFLSEADIAAPFSTKNGFYAVVIPDFAVNGAGVDWRLYDAIDGHWYERPIANRFHELTI
jgi:hypothetical protein